MKPYHLTLTSVALAALLVGCNENQAPTPAENNATEATEQNQLPKLSIGEQVKGEITSQSAINFNDGSRYQLFDLVVEADDVVEGNLLEITLRGPLNGTMSLFEDSELVATASYHDSAPKLTSLVEAGDAFQLAVNGQDVSSFGPFTLSSRVIDIAVSLDTANVYSLPVDESSWLGSDPQEMRFSVDQAGIYRIDLTSNEFDTLLKLSGNGISLENDDGPDGTNSQLVTFLEPAEYTLSLQSYSNGTGLFTVSVAEESLPEGVELQNSGILTPGTTAHGMLTQSTNSYSLEVPTDGIYEISLSSDTFDAYLELEGPGFYAEDDDGSGQGTDARLEVELTAGTYTLIARGFGGDAMGFYTLRVNPFD